MVGPSCDRRRAGWHDYINVLASEFQNRLSVPVLVFSIISIAYLTTSTAFKRSVGGHHLARYLAIFQF
jgi:hypothetical protein